MRSVLRKLLFVLACGALAASMANVLAESKQVGMGTWKLNVEKSKYSPGPAPKSTIVTFEPAGKGVKVTVQSVSAAGATTAYEFTANYDGKDVPIKGSPAADTVSLKRIDARSTTRTDKKGGKVVLTIKRVVAKDGKTFTATAKGTTPKGEPMNNVLVFEKQ